MPVHVFAQLCTFVGTRTNVLSVECLTWATVTALPLNVFNTDAKLINKCYITHIKIFMINTTESEVQISEITPALSC